MDAITGTDETAYKSLDVGKRNTVVKNVLRWERSQIGECLKICFQGDRPQQNRSDLPCRVQANGDQVRRALSSCTIWCGPHILKCAKLCKIERSVCLMSPPHLRTLPLSVWSLEKPDQSNYQVARLRQQLQDQALNCHLCRLLQISVKQIFTSLTCHKYTCCR